MLGLEEGATEGFVDGKVNEGPVVGNVVGAVEGKTVGFVAVGRTEGLTEGEMEGATEGHDVSGENVGSVEGNKLGETDGYAQKEGKSCNSHIHSKCLSNKTFQIVNDFNIYSLKAK